MIVYTSLTLFGYTILLLKERHKELTAQWPLTLLSKFTDIKDTISKILSFKYICRMDRINLIFNLIFSLCKAN